MNFLLHPLLKCCWRLLKPSKTFDTYIKSLGFSSRKATPLLLLLFPGSFHRGGYFYLKPGSNQRQLHLNISILAQSPTRPTLVTLTKWTDRESSSFPSPQRRLKGTLTTSILASLLSTLLTSAMLIFHHDIFALDIPDGAKHCAALSLGLRRLKGCMWKP